MRKCTALRQVSTLPHRKLTVIILLLLCTDVHYCGVNARQWIILYGVKAVAYRPESLMILLNIKCVMLDVDDCFSVGLKADAVSRIGREDDKARGLFTVIDKELYAVPVDDEAQLYLAAAVAYSELALVQHVFRPSAV